MAKSIHILKAQVLRIPLKTNCQNRLRIDFRNEDNVIELQIHVHQDNSANLTKSLKIINFAPFGS